MEYLVSIRKSPLFLLEMSKVRSLTSFIHNYTVSQIYSRKLDEDIFRKCIEDIIILYINDCHEDSEQNYFNENIFIKKLALYYYILIIKINLMKTSNKPKINEESDSEFDEYDADEQRQESSIPPAVRYLECPSLTSHMTRVISYDPTIDDIEKYIRFIFGNLKMTPKYIILVSILMERLCETKKQNLIDIVKDMIDFILPALIIIVVKLYGSDTACYNVEYTKRLKMDLIEINKMEIILMLNLKTHIDYADYFLYASRYI